MAELSPEQKGEDDRLEAAGVRTWIIAAVGGGLLAFLLAAIGVLTVFYRLETPDLNHGPPETFPTPRLETNINPRSLPADLPGPAQAFRPTASGLDEARLRAAMQAVVAKGAHAYDTLDAPTTTSAGAPAKANGSPGASFETPARAGSSG